MKFSKNCHWGELYKGKKVKLLRITLLLKLNEIFSKTWLTDATDPGGFQYWLSNRCWMWKGLPLMQRNKWPQQPIWFCMK